MTTPAVPPVSFSDRRAAVRYQLTARGWLKGAGDRLLEFRTNDLSTMGAGIWHADHVPAGSPPMHMLLTLPLANGVTRIEGVAEVRYSVLSQGGYRSGLLFRSISPAHATLLALALKNRLPVLDGN